MYTGGAAEHYATDAALRYLQDRKSQYHSNTPLYSLGSVPPPPPPLSQRRSQAPSSPSPLRDGTQQQQLSHRPHHIPAAAYSSTDESSTAASASAAPRNWAAVNAEMLYALNGVKAKVHGEQQQLELERGIREGTFKELQGSMTHQFAELRAVLKQLKDENSFLKKCVHDLQTRDMWRSGGGSGSPAGAASSEGDSGVASGVSQRLAALEATAQQHHERFNERSARLNDSMREFVESTVSVELERVRTLARDTARQALGALVKQEVERERDQREDALRMLESTVGKLEGKMELQLQSRIEAVREEVRAQSTALQKSVERVESTVAALPTAAEVVSQAESKTKAFRDLVDRQLQQAQRETESRIDRMRDTATASALSLREEILSRVGEAEKDAARRSVSRDEVSRLIDTAVGSLRHTATFTQESQQEMKGMLESQRKSSEEIREKLVLLQRTAERHAAAVEVLESQGRELRQTQQEHIEGIALLKTTLLDKTVVRLEEVSQSVDKMKRDTISAAREQEVANARLQQQIAELQQEELAQSERLRQCSKRIEEITEMAARNAARCDVTASTVERDCVPALQKTDKRLESIEQVVQAVSRQVEAQRGEEFPHLRSELKEDMEKQRRELACHVKQEANELLGKLEAFNADQMSHVNRLEAAWKQFQQDSALITTEDVEGEVKRVFAGVEGRLEELEASVKAQVSSVEARLVASEKAMREPARPVSTSPARSQEGEDTTTTSATTSVSPSTTLLLKSLQRQVEEVRANQQEEIARLELQYDEGLQRTQKTCESETRRLLRLQREELLEGLQAQVGAQLEAHTAQLPTRLHASIAAIVAEEWLQVPAIRLVRRLTDDEECVREMAISLQAAWKEDEEGGSKLNTSASSVPAPPNQLIPAGSATEGLLVEQLQHRLRQLEEWQKSTAIALASPAPATLDLSAGLDRCASRLTALETAVSVWQSTVQDGSASSRKDEGSTALVTAGLEALKRQIQQQETAWRTAFKTAEERLAVVEEKSVAVSETSAALHAQLAMFTTRQQEALTALHEAITSEVEMIVQPVTLRVKGMVERQKDMVDTIETHRAALEEEIHHEVGQVGTELRDAVKNATSRLKAVEESQKQFMITVEEHQAEQERRCTSQVEGVQQQQQDSLRVLREEVTEALKEVRSDAAPADQVRHANHEEENTKLDAALTSVVHPLMQRLEGLEEEVKRRPQASDDSNAARTSRSDQVEAECSARIAEVERLLSVVQSELNRLASALPASVTGQDDNVEDIRQCAAEDRKTLSSRTGRTEEESAEDISAESGFNEATYTTATYENVREVMDRLVSRVCALEERVSQLDEEGDAGLAATTSVLDGLQQSLLQCVVFVKEELSSPDWQTLLASADTPRIAIASVTDVFACLLHFLCKAHMDIRTLHSSMLSLLDVVQQHEMSAMHGAGESGSGRSSHDSSSNNSSSADVDAGNAK